MKSGDTQGHHLSFSQRSKGGGDVYQLSFPIVMFATIFLSTVRRFWNFLSFASAACSSVRNSWTTMSAIGRGEAWVARAPQSFRAGRTWHPGLGPPWWVQTGEEVGDASGNDKSNAGHVATSRGSRHARPPKRKYTQILLLNFNFFGHERGFPA